MPLSWQSTRKRCRGLNKSKERRYHFDQALEETAQNLEVQGGLAVTQIAQRNDLNISKSIPSRGCDSAKVIKSLLHSLSCVICFFPQLKVYERTTRFLIPSVAIWALNQPWNRKAASSMKIWCLLRSFRVSMRQSSPTEPQVLARRTQCLDTPANPG